MKWAPIPACLSTVLMCGVCTSAIAQTGSSHQPVRRSARAIEANLSYDVHITPTTLSPGSTSIETGGDTWNARGFDLKTLISQIYDVDFRRVDFPDDAIADARYDVTLTLPKEVDQDEMRRLLVDALQRKFGFTITPENRSMDVYVMSAPSGPGAELHRHSSGANAGGVAKLVALESSPADDDAGQITYMGKDCSGVSSGGIAVAASSISDFSRTLEQDLDRVLIDETKLSGAYDFQIGNYSNEQELFKLLHDQLGLVVTPSQRKVTVLTVRPADSLQAKL
jgi:uncharacterized protein (TIGR03435 family)